MNINNFTAMKIGLASPEKIREWSYGEVKSLKQSITVLRNLKRTVCSVSVFSVLRRTGNAPAENIRRSATRVLYVIVVVLKSQNLPSEEKEWVISNWQRRSLTSGI